MSASTPPKRLPKTRDTSPPPTLSAGELLQAASQPVRHHPPSPFDYDGDLQDLAAHILDLTRHQAETERALTLAHQSLRHTVDPWYRDRLACHSYEPSVRVPAGAHGCVRLTYQDRYLKLPASQAETLRALVGSLFDLFFHPAVSLKVRKDVAEDPQRLAAVVVRLGAVLGAEFAAIFAAEQTLLPTRAFTEQRYRHLDAAGNERLHAAGVQQVVAVGEGR